MADKHKMTQQPNRTILDPKKYCDQKVHCHVYL